MILATPAEIAEGIEIFLKDHQKKESIPDFSSEKMTISQASKFIDVSYPTLCKWVTAGQIPVHGKGRKRFVLRTELIDAYKQIK